ncbi:MAG: alanine--tRNA ligase [candidate division Zixibacteria bacterium]
MTKTRNAKIKTAEIRSAFLEFFRKNDHVVLPSSPVVPADDPTLLFTNAGMNQFKDIFTGKRKTDFKRATSSQKCIRAGGKHNDLDNVGFTSRHHTFFEMLGNFSFGDYYKEEAIKYYWEFFTKELDLDKSRLVVSVYETDDEAFNLWEKIAPELKNGRVMRFGKADNFWSMGNVGPCGPCSELHYDRGEKLGSGPDDVVNGEGERFVEIGNLVFMQDDQLPDGKIVPLPSRSVDTGAGLERIAAIMQDVDSNFGIDLFQNIIAAISDITHSRYSDHVASHHVIADHIRALSFALADGAGISNEGRGYVLRRILRRAVRHGRLLGAKEPFMYKLVDVLANEMSDAFPELRTRKDHLVNVIRAEEESFARTLETGLVHFEKLASSASSGVIDGAEVFKLYDTYGFPYDLTEIMAGEKNLTLDHAGFESALKEQQERSRAGSSFAADQSEFPDAVDTLAGGEERAGFTYEKQSVKANTIGSFLSKNGGKVAVALTASPFYAESGGQVGDIGRILVGNCELRVDKVEVHNVVHLHIGQIVKGNFEDFKTGTEVTAEVDADRRWAIQRNHTATHLLQAALRKVLGDHVHQSGSYVGPDRLRFDFSHHQPMTRDEIEQVEASVREQILLDAIVETEEMDIEAAKKSGATALFGEKYDTKVRVVAVDSFSKELCGGTHVESTSQIGPFFITLESGIASGVRRIEAITGTEALNFMAEARKFRQDVASEIGRPEADALTGVKQLRAENSSLTKELKKAREAMFAGSGSDIGKSESIGELTLVCHDFGDADRETMGAWLDNQKEANSPIVAVAIADAGKNKTFMLAASSSAVKTCDFHAGNFSKDILSQFGGRGGGKPNFAQGSVAADTNAKTLFGEIKDRLSKQGES